MSVDYERLCRTQGDAHLAANQAYDVAKLFLADERAVWIKCIEEVEPITAKQRRFFHGPVLQQISEQVVVEGQRYVKAIWKEHLRELFLPEVWTVERKPFVRDRKTGLFRPSKKAAPVRVRQSTEDLGVKGYSEFIDKTLAHGAVEWGVQWVFDIDERESVRYRPRKRQATAPKAEVKQLENADG